LKTKTALDEKNKTMLDLTVKAGKVDLLNKEITKLKQDVTLEKSKGNNKDEINKHLKKATELSAELEKCSKELSECKKVEEAN
jgi:hypothetical protein